MNNSFVKKHFGETRWPLIAVGFLLMLFMLVLTFFFTYHPTFHYFALVSQVLFFAFNVFLFFFNKKRKIAWLLYSVPFLISVLITFAYNGYDSHYNTVLSGFIVFISITHFATMMPNKKDIIVLLMLALVFFLTYFIVVYADDFYNVLKTNDFSKMRFGAEIAPINMITIYFDLGCSLLYFWFLSSFFRKRFLLSSLFIIGYVLFFVCGISTGSKQFLVVTFAVNLVSTFWFFGFKNIHYSILIVTFAFVIVAIVLSLPIFSTITSRFVEMFNFFSGGGNNDYSSAERSMMFEEAFYLFTKKPVFGNGIWSYAKLGSFGTYSHNTFSNIFCEFGLVGSCSFAIAFFVPEIVYILKKKPLTVDQKIVFSLLLCLAIQGLFGVLYLHKAMYVVAGIAFSFVLDGHSLASMRVKALIPSSFYEIQV